MALDTQYRPLRFEDVVGQEDTITVLREFVNSGSGFHQSYLFCGGHGSGKTTLARILARALLCETPKGGDPCDTCGSCTSILRYGASECFSEFDAATNSGKDDVKQITDSLQFDTMSGKRRIFLMDEAHRLSPSALDALLKPMEDTVYGSQDKMMVCIFCTTEPEKMKATIFSRCAPAFVIRTVPPERIAERLAFVCQQEQIPYEHDALVLIAAAVESHIRDALKAVEGISMMGCVDVAHTTTYLRLNTHPTYVRILRGLGRDLPDILASVAELEQVVSPAVAYEKLAELAVLAFTTTLANRKAPVYWNKEHIAEVFECQKTNLLNIAHMLSTRPSRSTYAMLVCDLATLHYRCTGELAAPVVAPPAIGMFQPHAITPQPPPVVASPNVEKITSPQAEKESKTNTPGTVLETPHTSPHVTKTGVYVDPRGINRRTGGDDKKNRNRTLDVDEFRHNLSRMVEELNHDDAHRGST